MVLSILLAIFFVILRFKLDFEFFLKVVTIKVRFFFHFNRICKTPNIIKILYRGITKLHQHTTFYPNSATLIFSRVVIVCLFCLAILKECLDRADGLWAHHFDSFTLDNATMLWRCVRHYWPFLMIFLWSSFVLHVLLFSLIRHRTFCSEILWNLFG